MDTIQNIPDPTISPQITPVVQKKPAFPLWGAAVIAICIGAGIFLTWRSLNPQSKPVVRLTPSPTLVPSPTPIRQLSALASQSAFLSLSTGVASLSSQLRNFVTEDPSLSPPVLDLPLGF